jgi:hypothetical protein
MGPAGTPFTTGDVKLTYKTVADAGWVMMNDGSIGNSGSGATTLADPSAQNLFQLFYSNCADADVPIQTSAGGATTRAAQGTANAAWTAGCRLILPAALGRDLAIAGSGSGLTGRSLGSNAGAETHTQSGGELCNHTHPVSVPIANVTTGGYGSYNGSTFWAAGYGSLTCTASAVGGSAPMSILSPRTHLNIMVCL